MRTHLSGTRAPLLVAPAVAVTLAIGACSGPSEDASSSPSLNAETISSDAASATTSPSTATSDSTATTPPTTGADCTAVTRVTLAVPGTATPRFAGYYAALQRGYFAHACLEVGITMTTSASAALTTLADGAADIAVAPLGEGLRAREAGSAVTNVAQVFQRSGTVQVSFATAGIDTPDAFRGKRVGVGDAGGWEVLAATSKAGLDPVADTTLVTGGGIEALMTGEVDAASAQVYDGLQRLVGQPQPGSGTPLTLEDLSVIHYQDEGVGLLPDGLWARSDRVVEGAGADVVQRFVTAALHGWIDCRDDAAACAALPEVSPSGDMELGSRMVQAVNSLIWPSPLGVGVIDPAAKDRTVQIALVTKDLDGARLITRAPDDGSVTTSFATTADAELSSEGLNVTG